MKKCQQIPEKNKNYLSLNVFLFPYPVWAQQAPTYLSSSTEVPHCGQINTPHLTIPSGDQKKAKYMIKM